jgi:pyrroline-5-carboxylate reductase
LVKAGQSLGLSHEQARLLTLQTALGAAKLAMESKENISELREGVTSPGGTTEQGLKIMNENNIDEFINKVVNAARQRSIELADMLGED